MSTTFFKPVTVHLASCISTYFSLLTWTWRRKCQISVNNINLKVSVMISCLPVNSTLYIKNQTVSNVLLNKNYTNTRTKNHFLLHIFKASALWANAFYKSKCPSVCLSVRLFVRVFTFDVLFKRLFAPTSQIQMSKILRDSEFLGKSNEKKWSHIWKLLLIKGLKAPRKKQVLFWQI